MVTLQILGGRKEKIRPGDVLGALTSEEGGPAYTREQIGKIQVTEFCTFVAVTRDIAKQACAKLQCRQGQRQECAGAADDAGGLHLTAQSHGPVAFVGRAAVADACNRHILEVA